MLDIELIKKNMVKTLPRCRYGYDYYWPLAPVADSVELAELGQRIMFRHGSPTQPDLNIFIAPKDELTAGFVIGICGH